MSLFIRFSGQGRAIAVPSMGLIPVAMLGRPLLVRIWLVWALPTPAKILT